MNSVRLVSENGVSNIQKKLWYVDNSSEINLDNFEAGDRIYSINDNKLYQIEYDSSTEQEYSGEIVSFEADEDDRISSLEVEINPVQDLHGYDNPWPAGGGTNILNLAFTSESSTVAGMTFTHDQSSFTLKGTASGTSYSIFTLASLPNAALNTDYTFSLTISGTCPGGLYGISFYNGSTLVRQYRCNTTDATSKTFQIPSSYDNVDFTLESLTSGLVFDCTIKVQFEKGSSKTAWTPYSNLCPISGHTGATVHVADGENPHVVDNEYPITFPDAAGTVYGGTLEVNEDGTGTLTATHASKTFTSSSDISKISTTTWYIEASKIPSVKNPSSGEATVMSDKFKSAYPATAGGCFLNTGGAIRFNTVAEYSDSSALMTALGSIQFVYPLATPITYQLDPVTVNLLLGQNNIWANTGDTTVKIVTNNKTLFKLNPHS